MLFKLKNRQGSLLNLFQQAFYNHQRHYFSMAYIAGCDLSSNFTLSKCSFLSSGHVGGASNQCFFPFLRKQFLHVNVERCIGLTPQGCVDSNGNNNNSNKLFLKPKPRCFTSFPRPPLLADTGDVTVRDINGNATLNTSLNRSPTKPLHFRDIPLSQKLNVAVDVDEGINAYDFSLSCYHK